jgi:hypothetical protein
MCVHGRERKRGVRESERERERERENTKRGEEGVLRGCW